MCACCVSHWDEGYFVSYGNWLAYVYESVSVFGKEGLLHSYAAGFHYCGGSGAVSVSAGEEEVSLYA